VTTADAARLFLRKATQDEAALVNLAADATIADEIVGFHAQQAVEKLLKAVLVFDGVRVRRTHDLAELSDLLTDHGRPMPVDVAAITDLNPFAVDYRYADMSKNSDTETRLDRPRALRLVQQVRLWAEACLVVSPPERP